MPLPASLCLLQGHAGRHAAPLSQAAVGPSEAAAARAQVRPLPHQHTCLSACHASPPACLPASPSPPAASSALPAARPECGCLPPLPQWLTLTLVYCLAVLGCTAASPAACTTCTPATFCTVTSSQRECLFFDLVKQVSWAAAAAVGDQGRQAFGRAGTSAPGRWQPPAACCKVCHPPLPCLPLPLALPPTMSCLQQHFCGPRADDEAGRLWDGANRG